jgi:hypothetical protein
LLPQQPFRHFCTLHTATFSHYQTSSADVTRSPCQPNYTDLPIDV